MPFDGRTFEQQDKVLHVLKLAREMVARPNGWCQGFFQDDAGAVCMMGAIGRAHLGYGVENLVLRGDAWQMLCDGIPDHNGRDYNDAEGRTQAEVVALFDSVIAWREGER